MSGIAWKRRLRAGPGLLQEVIVQEDSLDEALERTRRRMEVEGWPETLPALEPLRDMLRHRARLEFGSASGWRHWPCPLASRT